VLRTSTAAFTNASMSSSTDSTASFSSFDTGDIFSNRIDGTRPPIDRVRVLDVEV
jgi:hypothetical protein